MIAKDIKQYCIDDITTIENYDKAVNDSRIWQLHHRLETHDKYGNPLDKPIERKELIARKLYYSRPSSELIFLPEEEHKRIHMLGNKRAKGFNIGNQHAKGNVLSEKTRKQMGLSRMGNTNNGIALIKCLETNEVLRTREWILKGFQNAYNVAKGRQKSCHGYHFQYVKEKNYECN